jgi:hypothetical protein
MIERRREPRFDAHIAPYVWGVDIKGERFAQQVRARDISFSGALLSGLDIELSSGDVIGILYAGKKARYRVVWIRYDCAGDKMEAAVHRIAPDECPWQELLPSAELVESGSTNRNSPQTRDGNSGQTFETGI